MHKSETQMMREADQMDRLGSVWKKKGRLTCGHCYHTLESWWNAWFYFSTQQIWNSDLITPQKTESLSVWRAVLMKNEGFGVFWVCRQQQRDKPAAQMEHFLSLAFEILVSLICLTWLFCVWGARVNPRRTLCILLFTCGTLRFLLFFFF